MRALGILLVLAAPLGAQIVFDTAFGGSGQTTAQSFARGADGSLYVAGITTSTDFPVVNGVQSQLRTAPLVATADAGKTWSFPMLGPVTAVRTMTGAAAAPLVIYAVTQLGVYRSGNGGTSWSATAGAGLPGLPTELSVDSSSANIVYAATNQGVYVTSDGGASWSASSAGFAAYDIAAVAAHPSQPGTVYASVRNLAAFFRSTDFGQTWTQIPTPVDRMAPVIVIAFAADGSLVLGTPTELLVSYDGGNAWAIASQQPVYNGQALAVSPADANVVYLIGFNGLERSSDGGHTFTAIKLPSRISQFGRVVADPGSPGTVYVADDNVLYRSTDEGQTWSPVSFPYYVSLQWLMAWNARVLVGTATRSNAFVTKWSADGKQMLYSTYLGGTGAEYVQGIAVDAGGNAYVTGSTTSPDFPTTSGAITTKLGSSGRDVFVAKLSADGSKLMYSTLLGSPAANSAAIGVDSTGDAVVVGSVNGAFPVTANAFQTAPQPGCDVQIPLQITSPAGSAFVAKIAPGGDAFVYATLLGGNCASYANGVTVDVKGNAWVAGQTVSTNFPVTVDALQAKTGGGYYDGFLARLNPAGGLDYSTYIGGSGYDSMNAVGFDGAGNIFVAGQSGGLQQAPSPGAYQSQVNASCQIISIGPSVYSPMGNAMVLKLDPAAQNVLGLTYMAAPSCLWPITVSVDAAGEPWIAGYFRQNGTVPTVTPVQEGGPAFISKFSADFTQLLFSTYFDSLAGMALDSAGAVYVGGTGSYATSGAPAYVAKFTPPPAPIALDGIASAVNPVSPSSFVIAPGEVIRLVGRGIGPKTPAAGTIKAGVLATGVAGVQVTFDGTLVPLLSVSDGSIELVTPFGLAWKNSTTIQVQYNGVKSNSVKVGVGVTQAQILGVFNSDGSVNSKSNPAAVGAEMTMYVAGIGQTAPASLDGQVNAPPFAAPAAALQLQLFGPYASGPIPVVFAGAAPGLAAGIFQVNFIAPQAGVESLLLSVGGSFGMGFNVYAQ